MALEDTPAIFLSGPRQSGKSTLARQIGTTKGMNYLTLDESSVFANAKADPSGFINANTESPLILDEVQRVPELLLAIKTHIDRNRMPGHFLLTGSANPLELLPDSLAGRIEYHTLYPLAQSEIETHNSDVIYKLFEGLVPLFQPDTTILERIVRGGYPEVVQRRSERRNDWFRSYVNALLQRDIRDLANVSSPETLPVLLRLLASRTATLLNQADLARDVRLNAMTTGRYLHLLETMFLVHRLPAWARNFGQRIVKAPKIHLIDSGLVCSLLNLNRDALETNRKVLGQLLETFVVSEVMKLTTLSHLPVSLYHYRTSNGQEVDLLLEAQDGRIVALEIKASSSVNSSDFKGLRHLQDLLGKQFIRGIILYLGSKHFYVDKQLEASPVQMLWRL